MEFQYYSNIHPKNNELVLTIFENKEDSFFKGKLIEYDYEAIMNFHDATKKRRTFSWKKVLTLNKKMVARVDDVDEKNKIVQLSIAYLSDNFDKDIKIDEIQEKLMKNFNENKHLEKFIKSFCTKYLYNFINVWTTLIHHIDKLRNKEIESLWKYFIDNITKLKEWIDECKLENKLYEDIIYYYNNKSFCLESKITSKIGIISLEGINIIKSIIQSFIESNTVPKSFKMTLISPPFYIIETSNNDSTINDHENIIESMKSIIEKNNYNIYIKIEYIGKI
jgi:translation initiation factor 2 alpha subunit (eIF-2alpha)